MLLKRISPRSLLICLLVHDIDNFRVSVIHLTVTKGLELLQSHCGFLVSFEALKLDGLFLNDLIESLLAIFYQAIYQFFLQLKMAYHHLDECLDDDVQWMIAKADLSTNLCKQVNLFLICQA